MNIVSLRDLRGLLFKEEDYEGRAGGEQKDAEGAKERVEDVKGGFMPQPISVGMESTLRPCGRPWPSAPEPE